MNPLLQPVRTGPTSTAPDTPGSGDSLSSRMRLLHVQLMELAPAVDRIACVLYDRRDDMLRTFVNSTRSGEAIKGYEFPLSESASLRQIAASGRERVIDEIAAVVEPTTPHSQWLLEQGYRSSLTVPLYDSGAFIGFLFYDSCQPAAFSDGVQHSLSLFSTLINMMISNQLRLAQSIIASAQVARDFANLRDFETVGHLNRLAHDARLIARELQPASNLSDEYIEHLDPFAPLHDIGKIGIPDRVLLKPGGLSGEERQVMQTHVNKGVEVLEATPCPWRRGSSPSPTVLDALISHRPYKQAWPIEAALAELERLVEAGKFDAACVVAIRKHQDEVLAIRDRFRDEATAAVSGSGRLWRLPSGSSRIGRHAGPPTTGRSPLDRLP